MKASMDSIGTITIIPESPLETYALSKWIKQAIVVQADASWVRGDYLIVKLPDGHVESEKSS